MTAAVTDSQPPECPKCGKRQWPVIHSCTGIRTVTAAVPDPRFRDQLAEVLECANWCNSNYPSTGGGLSLLSPAPGCDCLEAHRLPQADALLPLIAAEVEARVQAAANQRAAEELEAEAAYDDAAPDEQYARYLFANRLRARAKNLRFDAAALAQPAPGGEPT